MTKIEMQQGVVATIILNRDYSGNIYLSQPARATSRDIFLDKDYIVEFMKDIYKLVMDEDYDA